MPDHTERPRRLIILRAAERLFAHYGPTKTTVADIARQASVGVGTVYLEFSSKDAILAELATSRHQQILDRIQRAARETGADHPARLRAVLDARVQAFLSQQEGGAHASDLLHCVCPAIARAWEAYQRAERDLLTQLIREGVAAGAFVSDDPAHTAATILDAYTCFAPPLLFHRDHERLPHDLAQLHRLVLQGLVFRDDVSSL